MNECRVVNLKELGVSKEVFDKIYSMGEEDGRADAIEEVKELTAQCVSMSDADWNWFESEVEQLKEQK